MTYFFNNIFKQVNNFYWLKLCLVTKSLNENVKKNKKNKKIKRKRKVKKNKK